MISKKQIGVFCAICSISMAFQLVDLNSIALQYPAYWPKPHYNFEDNPLTQNKIDLGRKLFYDPILSANNTVSCASCHLSYTAFTHVDHALSHGINDSIGTRNSPVLINLAWQTHFMWDGAINNIEVQALAPISHPAEMGEDLNNVLLKIKNTKNYPILFKKAFGDSIINSQRLLKSMAQFQLTLVSSNSKYDQVIAGSAEFSDQELKGYQLFKKHCNSCHTEPLFTKGEFANNGIPMDTTLLDAGRFNITQLNEDSMKFKIPTLRNIEFSQPYMHDGRFTSLSQVMKHYSSGISTSNNLNKDLSKGIELTDNQRIDLVSFLLTLSDKEFLFNPKFAYPREIKN